MITVSGLDKVSSRLDKFKLRVQFAAMKAVNAAAEETRNVLQRDAQATFRGGITPYVRRGIRFRSGQVVPGGVQASVFLSSRRGDKDQLSVSEILSPHIKGGGRERKSSERQPGIRPDYLTPSKYAPRDQYGNVPGPYMVKILSAIGAFSNKGYRMNRTAASGKRGGSHGRPLIRGLYVVPGVGIFQRQQSYSAGSGKTKHTGPSLPLFYFTRRPQYAAGTFDFYWVAKTFSAKRLPEELRKQLRIASRG